MELAEGRARRQSAELIETVARLVRLQAPLDRLVQVEMHDEARRLEAIARRARSGFDDLLGDDEDGGGAPF